MHEKWTSSGNDRKFQRVDCNSTMTIRTLMIPLRLWLSATAARSFWLFKQHGMTEIQMESRGRDGLYRWIFIMSGNSVFRYPPGCGASSNGWNWNIALKPWPGHSELATNSTYRSDPVLSTSTSVPWLQSTAIVGAPESVPSCTLIKSALFRQLQQNTFR